MALPVPTLLTCQLPPYSPQQTLAAVRPAHATTQMAKQCSQFRPLVKAAATRSKENFTNGHERQTSSPREGDGTMPGMVSPVDQSAYRLH